MEKSCGIYLPTPSPQRGRPPKAAAPIMDGVGRYIPQLFSMSFAILSYSISSYYEGMLYEGIALALEVDGDPNWLWLLAIASLGYHQIPSRIGRGWTANTTTNTFVSKLSRTCPWVKAHGHVLEPFPNMPATICVHIFKVNKLQERRLLDRNVCSGALHTYEGIIPTQESLKGIIRGMI